VNDRFELVVPEGSAAHAHGAMHEPAARPRPGDAITISVAIVTASPLTPV
jgi:hypothetical protein